MIPSQATQIQVKSPQWASRGQEGWVGVGWHGVEVSKRCEPVLKCVPSSILSFMRLSSLLLFCFSGFGHGRKSRRVFLACREVDLIRSSLSFLRLAKGNLSSEQIPSCLWDGDIKNNELWKMPHICMHLNSTWAICTLSQERGWCWLSQFPVLTENPQTLAEVRMCTVTLLETTARKWTPTSLYSLDNHSGLWFTVECQCREDQERILIKCSSHAW